MSRIHIDLHLAFATDSLDRWTHLQIYSVLDVPISVKNPNNFPIIQSSKPLGTSNIML